MIVCVHAFILNYFCECFLFTVLITYLVYSRVYREMSKAITDAVAERRLRPIYDWLDNGNNKKAIQEADKVLKKQPDLLCAKVLKGLALLRMGKSKDCEDILDSVRKEAPADDCTLQAMTICYREVHKLENICDVYKEAVQKDPLNEELNTHLFMSYVRISDYKKQQQVALNLYKIKPKNPYYFWGVMSILMQAQSSDERIAQKVMLPLAERMVKKFIDEGKIEAEQEIQLYIMILEMQKKYSEALEMIESELGQKILSYFTLSRKRMKLLELLKNWRDLNIYAKKLLLEEPDAYNFYVSYIDSVLQLLTLKNESKPSVENGIREPANSPFNTFKDELITADDAIELCAAFIHKCQEQNEIPHRLRGPYLASLLLYKRLTEEGFENASKYVGNLLDLFKNYFELFADKACCFKDLQPFLSLMRKDEHVTFLSSLEAHIKKTETGEVKNKKQMIMYLTYFEINKYFEIQETFCSTAKLTEISSLLDFYHDGHRFNTDIVPTDLGASDTFMILVAHLLYDLYLNTCDLRYIKDAICLLEYAFSFSPSNHHFKLLLLKFYNLLGATKAGYKYFMLLEIKHMQYDSLGYLECWPLLYSGQYSLAVHLLDSTLKFFNINYKEAADQLTHAYKYGSFEKVTEFLSFRERLKNSFHYSLVSIEHLITDLIHLPSHEVTVQAAQQLSINPEKPIADSNHLVDNRDVYLFLDFNSDSRRMNEKYRQLSFEHEVELIRLRTMILRCIGASVNVCISMAPSKTNQNVDNENSFAHSNGLDDSSSKHLDTYFNVIMELKEMYSSFLNNPPQTIPKEVFSGVAPSHLFMYLKSSFFLPVFIDTMSFAHKFCSHCLTTDSSDKEIEKIAEVSTDKFSKVIADCNSRILSIQSSYNSVDHREIFEFMSLVVEIICILSIICGNMHSVLLGTSKTVAIPARRKKKKNKDSSPVVSATIENKNKDVEEGMLKVYTSYLSNVRDNVKAFETHLSLLESCWSELETHKSEFSLRRRQYLENSDAELNPTLGISDQKWSTLQSEVNYNICDSYRSSINQFRNVVSHKAEYLSLLC